MSIVSAMERHQATCDIRRIILSSGQTACLLRRRSGERLYGSDDAAFVEVESFPLELNETPPESLGQKIAATACIPPDVDVRPQDRIRIGNDDFRVQTIKDQRLFGVITHKVIELVRIHGS